MRNVRAAILLAAALVAAPAAQGRNALDTVKAELGALLKELNAAVASKDAAALDRIYADEFLFVHALGAPVDKKGQIAAALAAAPGGSVPVPALDGLLVYGDVAILRQPVDGRFGTTIYARKNGRWQILQLQGTPTPSARPSVTVAADVLASYAGRYRQDNGLFVTIGVENGALTLQLDGRQKLTLTADSDTAFTLPAGAGAVTFAKGAGGEMTYEVKRGNGAIVKGIRER